MRLLGKWRDDNDSMSFCRNILVGILTLTFTELTFIVLARTSEASDPGSISLLPMIGDVNLFLKDSETEQGDRKEAEVEIMIAGRQCSRAPLSYLI